VAPGADGPAGGGGQGGAGGVLHHSGAGVAQQPEPVPVHLGADGVPAGVPECAGGHLPHGPSAFGDGSGVPSSPWAAAPGHLSAAGDALFPHGGIFGPGPLLESRGSGGDHRFARRVHGRAAVHRQGLLPDGRSVCMDRHHRGGVSGI